METQSLSKGGFNNTTNNKTAETCRLPIRPRQTLLCASSPVYRFCFLGVYLELVGMTTALSSTEAYSLLSLSLAAVGVLLNTFTGEGEPLIASIAFSCLAFASCYALIRWLGDAFIRRGFKGKDLCKLKQTEMYDQSCRPTTNAAAYMT